MQLLSQIDLKHMPGPQQQQQVEEQQPLSKVEQLYHDMVSQQIKAQVKKFELKLNSVHKERERMILIVERTLKRTFAHEMQSAVVALKQYGSQASSLAVDLSDVDLAVTGLRLTDQHSQIAQMGRLARNLTQIEHGMLVSCDFIETASVPVIKLTCDLQQVQQVMRDELAADSDAEEGALPYVALDSDMRLLQIDITFECLSLDNP